MPKITRHKFDASGTELKRCSKCKAWKVLGDFYKHHLAWDDLRPSCKNCTNLKISIYKEQNKEKIKVYQRDYRKNNVKLKKQRNLHRKKRRKEDPQFRLTVNMRVALGGCLKKARLKKTDKTFKYFSCSPSFLLDRLERQRKERGLDAAAHVDHMMPIDSFDLKNAEELRRCWHWSNLQLLSAEENLRKNNKILYDMKWAGDEWVIRTKEGNGLYRPTALFRSVLVV